MSFLSGTGHLPEREDQLLTYLGRLGYAPVYASNERGGLFWRLHKTNNDNQTIRRFV